MACVCVTKTLRDCGVNDMEHPSIVHTMSTGYPEPEPIQFYKCNCCGVGIYEGEEYVEHAGNAFCDMACLSSILLSEGNAERRVAGE